MIHEVEEYIDKYDKEYETKSQPKQCVHANRRKVRRLIRDVSSTHIQQVRPIYAKDGAGLDKQINVHKFAGLTGKPHAFCGWVDRFCDGYAGQRIVHTK